MSNKLNITLNDFENICRTCLSRDDLKPLYKICLPSTSLVEMLTTCTAVKFSEDDGLPVNICTNCLNAIKQAFSFAQRCETTDTILRKCVININTEFVNKSFQSQNVHVKEEIKIEVKPEITHRTLQDVLGDYKVKQEDDMKRELTSEINLPTVDIFLDDFQHVEEVTRQEDINEEYEETIDDPMIEKNDEGHSAKYSKKSDNLSSRPRRRCTISQIEKNSSKDEDSETCDNSSDESYEKDDDDEDQDEFYSEKATHSLQVSPDSHPKIKSGPRSYACDVSKKSYKLIHTGEKPHVCSVCSKGFISKDSLKVHMREHTGEKRYTCDVCCKAFITTSNLKSHMRRHTGEKHYTCEVCSKAFTQSNDLKRHMRQHTGEKPYTCDICSKDFTQSGHLRRHMRLHTAEIP